MIHIPNVIFRPLFYTIFAVLVIVCSLYVFYKRRVIISDFKSILSKSTVIELYNDLRSLKGERWSLILILLLGTFLRFWNLANWVPIFVDEGAWGIWGKAVYENFALDDFRWLFITYRFAGKPALVAILYALSFNIFGFNLFAIRVVSAIAGFLTVFFVYKLGQILYGSKVGLVSGLIFAIIPYDIYYSRLALQDPVVSCLIAGAILCYSYGFKNDNTFSILLGGVVFGLALDAKQLGLKIGIIIIFYLLLTKDIRSYLKKAPLWISSILAAIFHYPFIYFAARRDFNLYTTYLTKGKAFSGVISINTTTTTTISSTTIKTAAQTSSDLISRALNLPTILSDQLAWMLNMFTISIFILFIAGIGLLLSRKRAIDLLPVIWIMVELFTSWVPHNHATGYILSIVPPATLTAGISLTFLSEKVPEIIKYKKIGVNIPNSVISLAIISICVSYTLFFSCTLIFTPREAQIHSDFKKITDSRWSGYGWQESIDYLQQENYSADTVIFPMPRWGFEFIAKDLYPRIYGSGYITDYFNGAELSRYLIEDNTCVFLIRRYTPDKYKDFASLVEIFPDIRLVKIIEVYEIPEVYIFVKS
ncbi:MAG: ArnT family glycosyltransferase [Promethearchaeota archaeon]